MGTEPRLAMRGPEESPLEPQLVRWCTRLAWLLGGAVCLGGGIPGLWDGLFGRDGEPWVQVYRDDAYYCFEWSSSVVRGDGPRVGAGAPTSGVHLLWQAVLLVPAVFGKLAVELSARWIGLALLFLAGWILRRALVRENCTGPAPTFAALTLLGALPVVLEAQNGQETALGIAACAWVLHERRASWGRFLLATLLVVFARSDLLAFAAVLALLRADRPWPIRGAAPLLALCVYAVVQYLLAGRVLQDSAEPMAWLFHQSFAAGDPSDSEWLRQLWWWGRPVLLGRPFADHAAVGMACLLVPTLERLRVRCRWLPPVGFLGLVAAAGLGLDDVLVPLLAFGLVSVPGVRSAFGAREGLLLLAAAVALVALHSLIRWYPRDYYFTPFALVGAYAVGRTVAAGGPRAVLTAIGVLVVGGLQLASGGLRTAFDGQRPMELAARYLHEVCPEVGREGERIGAFNSGLLAWRQDLPVVNLDGVVNRPAFEALRAGALSAWLDVERVGWLCDNPLQFGLDPEIPHACGAWFGGGFDPRSGLVEWARFVDPERRGQRAGTEVVVLYRRDGVEAPPRQPTLRWLREPRYPADGALLWIPAADDDALRRRDSRGDTLLAEGAPGIPQVLSVRPPSPGGEAAVYSRAAEEPIIWIRTR